MKKYVLLIIVFLQVCVVSVAQDKHEKERSIKTTDLYLYGEATADSETEATSTAKKILLSQIYDFEPALINRSEPVEAMLANSGQYITMPRGIKFRTIAFALKSEIESMVKVELASTADVSVEESVSEISEVKAETLQSQEEVATEAAASEMEMLGVAADPDVSTVAEEPKMSSIGREAIATTAVVESSEIPKTDPEAEGTVESEKPAKSEEISIQHVFTSSRELLDYIITVDQAGSLQKIFDEQKRKGMLIYGGSKSLSFADKCYLVYYTREGEVLCVLDKGAAMRKNLRNGALESRENYSEYPFVWFQLMD